MKAARGGTGANQHTAKEQKDTECTSANTAVRLGELFGVHPNTIKKDGKFAEEVDADPELVEAEHGGDRKTKAENQPKYNPVDTAEEVGKEFGISRDTVRRAGPETWRN